MPKKNVKSFQSFTELAQYYRFKESKDNKKQRPPLPVTVKPNAK